MSREYLISYNGNFTASTKWHHCHLSNVLFIALILNNEKKQQDMTEMKLLIYIIFKKFTLKTKSDDKVISCPNFVQQQLTLYNLHFWEPIAFEIQNIAGLCGNCQVRNRKVNLNITQLCSDDKDWRQTSGCTATAVSPSRVSGLVVATGR